MKTINTFKGKVEEHVQILTHRKHPLCPSCGSTWPVLLLE